MCRGDPASFTIEATRMCAMAFCINDGYTLAQRATAPEAGTAIRPAWALRRSVETRSVLPPRSHATPNRAPHHKREIAGEDDPPDWPPIRPCAIATASLPGPSALSSSSRYVCSVLRYEERSGSDGTKFAAALNVFEGACFPVANSRIIEARPFPTPADTRTHGGRQMLRVARTKGSRGSLKPGAHRTSHRTSEPRKVCPPYRVTGGHSICSQGRAI